MEQRRQRYNARMANFFAHLRVHSEYSINDGVGRLGGNIGNIITQAAKIGIPALALTDTAIMFGALKFYNACREAALSPSSVARQKLTAARKTFITLSFCAPTMTVMSI